MLDLNAAGVVAIAPTGDTGTTVAFPAAMPGTLAVTALAHNGPTCTTPNNHWSTAYSLYTPGYTPIAAGADLAAPGHGVLTTAGGTSYTAADGTALAAAHVTGLSALALAHHPTLRAQARTATRLHHLHTILTASSTPVPAMRPTGKGLPDALTALGLPFRPSGS